MFIDYLLLELGKVQFKIPGLFFIIIKSYKKREFERN